MTNTQETESCATAAGFGDAGRRGAGLILTIAFLSTWVPCFLRNGLLGRSCFESAAMMGFVQALPVGCLVATIVCLLFPMLRVGRNGFGRNAIRAAAGAYGLGYGILLVAVLLDSPSLVASFAGIISGVGVSVVGIWWCSQTEMLSFSRMLLQGTVVSAGSLLVMRLFSLMPAEVCVGCWLVLACGFAIGALVLQRNGVSRECSNALGEKVTWEFSELLSSGSGLSVIVTSAIGLMPFVLLSDVSQGVTVGDITFNAATGLLIGAVLTLVLAWLARGDKPIAPALFWSVFPACAGVLVVLVSFPKESLVSTLSAGLAYAYFSMLGVFAVVCLAQMAAQKEFPAAMVVAPPLAFASMAALIATVLGGLEIDAEQMGATLLVITTAYFVFLMLTPAFQLRRVLRDGEAVDEKTTRSDTDFNAACTQLAERHGLSKREREVFQYLVKGYTSPYIAKALFVSDSTIRSHTKSIYRKFDVNSRSELIEMVQHATEGNAA